jgi:hypothetical protein
MRPPGRPLRPGDSRTPAVLLLESKPVKILCPNGPWRLPGDNSVETPGKPANRRNNGTNGTAAGSEICDRHIGHMPFIDDRQLHSKIAYRLI